MRLGDGCDLTLEEATLAPVRGLPAPTPRPLADLFGAAVLDNPDGTIAHGEFRIGDSPVMFAEAKEIEPHLIGDLERLGDRAGGSPQPHAADGESKERLADAQFPERQHSEAIESKDD